jgi:hypothetical protein
MLAAMWDIFTQVLLPVLAMVGLGAGLQRWQPMHMATLAKLNMYLFVPALLYESIVRSALSWGQIGGVVAAVLLTMAVVGAGVYATGRSLKLGGTVTAAAVLGAIVHNAGNFGFPVARLAFDQDGGNHGQSVQAIIIVLSNISIWAFGYAILALARGDGARGVLGFFRLPMVYVMVLGFGARETGWDLPAWLGVPVAMMAEGSIPLMLITLGAQLAQRARWPRGLTVGPVLAVKLLIMPAVAAVVVWALGLWPWPGAAIIVGLAAPTAVNTLIITLELEGDAELAADFVFWTTVFSAVTVTIVLTIVQSLGGMPPG